MTQAVGFERHEKQKEFAKHLNDDFGKFYEANKGLVRKVATKVFARLQAMGAAVEYADVEQEASIIMMRTYDKFDPSLGFTFSTYFMKAAFYDLKKFIRSYEQDKNVLGVFSMSAATDGEGESVDMELTIDGHHGSPEQALEAKQLLQEIEQRLSPLAFTMLQIMMDPPEQIEREWQITRSMRGVKRLDITLGFVGDYLAGLTGATRLEISAAGAEIGTLSRSLNV